MNDFQLWTRLVRPQQIINYHGKGKWYDQFVKNKKRKKGKGRK